MNETVSEYAQTAAPRRRMRALATAVLVAFLLGGALVFYIAWSNGWIAMGEEDPAVAAAAAEPGDAELAASAAPARRPVLAADLPPPTTVEFRLNEMERRLNRLDLQAETASGNAARAEGLLIAFAARRLVERGEPLGSIENQLRQRFGNAQPNAVSTILDAARNPVTLESLRGGLAQVADAANEQAEQLDGWERIRRELSELFILRKADAASPREQERLTRARERLDDGQVEAAAALVAEVPNEEQTAPWLREARRYISIQNALALVETAALLEPRTLVDGTSREVRQPSAEDAPTGPAQLVPTPQNSVKVPEATP